MLSRELAQAVEDVDLDLLRGLLWVTSGVRNDRRGKVCVVDRVVDRERDLKLCVVIDWAARDTSPHWLESQRTLGQITIDRNDIGD